MLSNYLKIAFRNLLRHKGFSFINIFGLGMGMAGSILLLLWVVDELSYDRFHLNYENIFRVTSSLPELDVNAAITSAPLAEAFVEQISEVEDAVRIQGPNSYLLQVGEKMFQEEGTVYADSNFLQFFSFPLVAGDPKTALLHPESIVITEAMAKKYFGDEEALGKVVRRNHKDDFKVTGILEDIPANSHLHFDFLIPMSFKARTDRNLKENIWNNYNFYTYLRLDGNTASSPDELLALAHEFKVIYAANEPRLKVQFGLQPLENIHLHSKLMKDVPGHGNIEYVYMFSAAGVFILAVACMNFMSLATARSTRRAKEVGLRKVSGAARVQLVTQFLSESALIACLSLLLALGIVFAALPLFNDLAGKNLGISFLNLRMVLALVGITVITGLVAGSYPAFFLSSFVPATVLKGNSASGVRGATFRNIIVVIQFTVSIALLVGTAIIYEQLEYIKNKNIGLDKENLIYAPITGDLWNKRGVLETSLEQNPLTSEFTFVSDLPTLIPDTTPGVEWEGKDPDAQPLFSHMMMDENALSVFNISLLAGRNFSSEIASDAVNLIVNEAALQAMDMPLKNAVGQSITLWGKKGAIVGVVKDFNFQPLRTSIDPLILRYNAKAGIAVVRTKPQQTALTIEAIEKIFRTLNPEFPFSYNFVDQDLDNMYMAEYRVGSLFTVFSGLAIFISCLGLYGLSAFLAERCTKEIGIRKVLGAPVAHIVYLLSKTFTKPVLVAMVIATPLSWYVMDQWLAGFAYHVDINWMIYMISFAISLAVAWITVSFESIKAALADPAKSLRNE